MEDNKNRNYDQDDRNYPDIPNTNLEKSKLDNDLNQEPQNEEGFEEFTSDQPNRFNEEDRNQDVNNPNSENDLWIADKNRSKNDSDQNDENYQDEYRRNPLKRDR